MDLVPLLRSLVAIDSTSSRSNLPVLDRLEDAARRARVRDAARHLGGRERRGQGEPRVPARPGRARRPRPRRPHRLRAVRPGVDRGARRARSATARCSGAARPTRRGSSPRRSSRASRTRPARHPLALLFTADEEVGCLGAKRLLAEGRVHPRHAIVGEPTRLTPVRAHKGYCAVEVVIEGVEGHSAYPDVGASAIHAPGPALARDRADRRGAPARGRRRLLAAAHHLERRRHPRREGAEHHRRRVPLHLRVAAAARARTRAARCGCSRRRASGSRRARAASSPSRSRRSAPTPPR